MHAVAGAVADGSLQLDPGVDRGANRTQLLALPGVGVDELLELGRSIAGQGRFLDGARFLESQTSEWPQHAETLSHAAHRLRSQLN